jgi:hypothetical protein
VPQRGVAAWCAVARGVLSRGGVVSRGPVRVGGSV